MHCPVRAVGQVTGKCEIYPPIPAVSGGGALRWLQMALTTTEPSPTDEATRLTEPERTSPTAKMPGQEVA